MGEIGGRWEAVFCTGTFERSLDAKSRVLLPKSVKNSVQSGQDFYLTPGLDQCLELHTLDTIEKRAKEAEESGANTSSRKSFSRLFFAQAEKCELDSQNRIRIPQRLVEWSSLSNRIVILGVGSNWEIWNEEDWQTYYQQHKAGFDVVAQTLLDGGNPLEKIERENIKPMTPK